MGSCDIYVWNYFIIKKSPVTQIKKGTFQTTGQISSNLNATINRDDGTLVA